MPPSSGKTPQVSPLSFSGHQAIPPQPSKPPSNNKRIPGTWEYVVGGQVTQFRLCLGVSGLPVCYKIRRTNPFHINVGWGGLLSRRQSFVQMTCLLRAPSPLPSLPGNRARPGVLAGWAAEGQSVVLGSPSPNSSHIYILAALLPTLTPVLITH